MKNSQHLWIIGLITAVIFGGIGFIVGKRSASPSPLSQGVERMGDRGGFAQNGGPNRIQRGQGGGGTQGEVLSKDANVLTVKLRDGGSRIVFYATSTGVMRTASGTMGDIGVGSQVFVVGNQNADGSVTAESIQIRPEGMMLGR